MKYGCPLVTDEELDIAAETLAKSSHFIVAQQAARNLAYFMLTAIRAAHFREAAEIRSATDRITMHRKMAEDSKQWNLLRAIYGDPPQPCPQAEADPCLWPRCNCPGGIYEGVTDKRCERQCKLCSYNAGICGPACSNDQCPEKECVR